jgi:diaminohydroxyphosphoribosylaminopyrimidine deaminase / 5-amino-6-(5-phosphoribosylamino)uracil reductase
MIPSRDAAFMHLAYSLAGKALGRTSPNPCVGAVLVRAGRVIGYGHHEGAGYPHAEIVALGRAGRSARGATLYVTLEPCVHWGRTPPCVDKVLAAALDRIVVSAVDPNPLVAGRGLERIREAGIGLTVGVLAERHERLNAAYDKFITRRIPYVTLKAAVSLDGRMATRTGDSRWISSAAARDYVHLVRGEQDAILVGIATALRDDPLLTVRHANWPDKKIVRVILDPGLRFSPRARLLSSLSDGPVLIFAAPTASAKAVRALESRGAEVIRTPGAGGRLRLSAVLAELGRREISSVIVEGGGAIATAFLEGRLADRILLAVSPRLIGGKTAVPLYGGRGPARLADALGLRKVRSFRLGDDLIVEGSL